MRKTLAILLTVVAVPAVSHAKLEKSMKKDCLVCHQNWLLEAKVSSPKLLTDKKVLAGDTIMCLTCHDGSMADDRLTFLNFDKHSHPVDVKVPADMKIPKKYPLVDGKLFCGTCHTPHTEVGSQDKIDYTFMRFKNTDSSMCIDCHKKNVGHGNHPVLAETEGKMSPELIEEVERLHGKVGKNGEVTCQSCHAAHKGQGEHALIVSNKNSQLCAVCHTEELNSPQHNNPNSHPVLVSADVETSELKLGDGNTVQCYTCHKAHHAPEKRLLATSEKKLCADCHTSEKTVLHSKHGFTDKNACLECHTAHKAVGPALWGRELTDKAESYALFIGASDEDKLCISCHYPQGDAPDVGTITHPTNVECSVSSLPMKDGKVSCVTCHDPHRWSVVDNPVSKADASFLRLPEKELCGRCHADKLSVIHGVHKSIEATNVLGENSKNAGNCAACHVPHKAVGAYLRGVEGGEGYDKLSSFCMACHGEGGVAKAKVMAGKFKDHPVNVMTKDGKLVTCVSCHEPHNSKEFALQKPVKGDSSLCLDCHKSKDLKGTAHYLVAKDETIKEHGQCYACHKPHNPEGPTLWSRELGEGKTINERQCSSCHAKGKMAADLTTGKITHPLGGNVTSHVLPAINQETGIPDQPGVVDCGSCHDPHGNAVASNFLRMSNKGSELCISCHKEEVAIKGTGHDINGQMCNACHVPHQAKSAFLWKLDLKTFTYPNGEPVDRASTYCLTCHSESGVASNAVVKYYFHPREDFDIVNQDRPGRKGKWPVFAEDGSEVKRGGAIACETCHDAHIHGKTYFLRNKTVAGSTCVDCHGEEALIRYEWYHKPEVRQQNPSYR